MYKFELKKVSYSQRLSQETNAFAADIYIDGVKAGDAQNDGHGGETNCSLHYLTPEKRKEIQTWISQQPPKEYPGSEGKPFTIPFSLEVIVDDLMEEWLDNKYGEGAQKKKWCKKDVVFRVKGDKIDSYRTIKGKDNGVYTKRLKDTLVKRYGDQLEEIVNETLGEMPV